jgi:hypothetical protein
MSPDGHCLFHCNAGRDAGCVNRDRFPVQAWAIKPVTIGMKAPESRLPLHRQNTGL